MLLSRPGSLPGGTSHLPRVSQLVNLLGTLMSTRLVQIIRRWLGYRTLRYLLDPSILLQLKYCNEFHHPYPTQRQHVEYTDTRVGYRV